MDILIKITADEYNDIYNDMENIDLKISFGTDSVLKKVICETEKVMDILDEEISEFRAIKIKQ